MHFFCGWGWSAVRVASGFKSLDERDGGRNAHNVKRRERDLGRLKRWTRLPRPRGAGRAVVAAALLTTAIARGDVVTGENWRVVFNRPDQTTTLTSIGPNEFDIRDAFLERINALQAGDSGWLATYTFTGSYAQNGAAGPILAAVSNALARGARMGFVVGSGVDLTEEFWPGCSLQSLSKRKGNALEIARAPAKGIMHHKVGAFFYQATGEARLLTASWNFTAWASSRQWNILTDFANRDLAVAYSNEVRELLRGYFHSNPNKSRVPQDKMPFRTPAAAADGWSRFAPYPSNKSGGDNAQTQITNRIGHARESIWFALNKQTRAVVTDQLIAACDRGVEVHGVIPVSDRKTATGNSYEQYQRMLDPANYATTNRVHLHDAFYKYNDTVRDTGQVSDLVHCKYMVIDPFGRSPWVIHGSANWTLTALATTNTQTSNDENVLFIPDGGVARAFLSQFEAMTGVAAIEPDPMSQVRLAATVGAGGTMQLACVLPEGASGRLVAADDLQTWEVVQTWELSAGSNTVSVSKTAARRFYRVELTPGVQGASQPAAPAARPPAKPLAGDGELAVMVTPSNLTAIGESGLEYTVEAHVENNTGLEISQAEWTLLAVDGLTNEFAGLQVKDGQLLMLVPAPEDGGRLLDAVYTVVMGEGGESVTHSATCRVTMLRPRLVDFETLGPTTSYPTNLVRDEVTGEVEYIGVTTNFYGMDWKLFNMRRSLDSPLGGYAGRLRHSSLTVPGLLESRDYFDGIGSISVHYALNNISGFLTFVIETRGIESEEWTQAGASCRVEAGGDMTNQMHTVDVNLPGPRFVRIRTTGGFGNAVNLDNLLIRPYGDLVPYLEVEGGAAAAVGQEYELVFRVVNGEGAPRVWSNFGVERLDGEGGTPLFGEWDGDLRLVYTPTAEDLGQAFMATGTVSIYGGEYELSTNWTFQVEYGPDFELLNASAGGRTVLYTNEILDVWSTNVFIGGEPCTNRELYTAEWSAYPPFVTNTVRQYNRFRIGGVGLLAGDAGNHDLFLTITDKTNGLSTTRHIHFLVLDREEPDPRHLTFEDFAETSLDAREVMLSGANWSMAGVRAGWQPDDRKVGTTAARVECPGEGAAFLDSVAGFEGIGYLELACAGYGGEAGGEIRVLIQPDGADEFTALGEPVPVSGGELAAQRIFVDAAGPVRVRLEITGPAGHRINLDEIKIGLPRPEERIVVEGDLEIPAGGGFDLRFVPTNLPPGVEAVDVVVLRDGWDVTEYSGDQPLYQLTTTNEPGGHAGMLEIHIQLSNGFELETVVPWLVRGEKHADIAAFRPGHLTIWGEPGWRHVIFALEELGLDPREPANWVWAVTNIHVAAGEEGYEVPAPNEPPVEGHRRLFFGVHTTIEANE